MRSSYEESFAIIKERVEIIGEPRPGVTRPPRHDDEAPGPSIFRALVEDVSLTDLTLTGLFVGRSELKRVSFHGADLRVSAINWSDLSDCDFSGADLSGADLRACRFVRCSFAGANLSEADLRRSTFEGCELKGATMRGSKLHRARRVLGIFKSGTGQDAIPLSRAQRDDVAWCEEGLEPGSG